MSTSTDFTVRLASLSDEDKILALCWDAHKEMPDRRLSIPKVQGMVRGCLSGNGIIGVVDACGDIRGMVGLIATTPWFSEDNELHDWLTFVRADCRHLRYFSALLRFAKGEAERVGLPLHVGHVGDDRMEAKARAYRRHFPKYGEFFRYTPTQAA